MSTRGQDTAGSVAPGSRATGRFITLEGVEGVGKSTNLAFVADCVRAAGFDALVTREPGGTPPGEELRALLLRPGLELDPLTETLLMFAARAEHLARVIRPALAEGRWVICDRFTDASHAYQGGGRGVPAETLASLEGLVQRGLTPDLTLLLDAPADVAAGRQAARGGADRFEDEEAGFFARVKAAYLARASAEPGRIRLIDAGRPLEAVQADIRAALAPLLGTGKG